MKIFLTGDPHIGKSTMLNKLIENVQDKQGFVTNEIPNPDKPGSRAGFELIDSAGRTAILAHTNSQSPIRVSRYGVEIENFNTFIEPLQNFSPTQLLYIDEVGEMELHSSRFRDLVYTYLKAPNPFIGTVSNHIKDPLIQEIINNPQWQLFDITTDNRDLLLTQLQSDLKRAGY